jgi:hypothetical protein
VVSVVCLSVQLHLSALAFLAGSSMAGLDSEWVEIYTGEIGYMGVAWNYLA